MDDWKEYVIDEEACRHPIYATTVNSYIRYLDPTIQKAADLLGEGISLSALAKSLGWTLNAWWKFTNILGNWMMHILTRILTFQRQSGLSLDGLLMKDQEKPTKHFGE